MGDETRHASHHKHRHSKDDHDRERKHKRTHKHGKESSRKRLREDSGDRLHIVDEDPQDDDMWVEKNIDMEGEVVRTPSCVVLFAGLTHARDVPATRDGHPIG